MTISEPLTLTQRAKDILQSEGFFSFIRKAFRFFISFLFKYRTYYFYHETLDARARVDYSPKVKDFTLKIVQNNEQADELAAVGLECRYPYDICRERLDKGAILFCIFIDRELAHKVWIAMTEAVQLTFNWFPFRVNFAEGEVYEADLETNPKYRRLGLSLYCDFARRRFLGERGIKAVCYIIAMDDINKQRKLKLAELGVLPCAKATSLRILRLRFWKEHKLS